MALSLSLSLSLLLAAVFATSLFLLPRPSVVYAASNDAISYDPATKTVKIQGDCTTDEIYTFMHGQGEGVSATTLHFAGTSVIQTLQCDPDSGTQPDSSKGPFASTQLVNIEADSDAQVLFTGKDENTAPVLMGFFAWCSSLSSLDGLSAWDVGNVSGNYCMQYMFYYCLNLTSLDSLSAWNVGNVSGNYCMGYMFKDCTSLTSLDGLSAWNVGNVSGKACMSSMFEDCTNLTSLDGLSAWDVGNVKGECCMQYMFGNCTSLTSLDGLSAWNVSDVRGDSCMNYMFYNCTNLTSLDGLSAWDIGNVSDDYCMQSMFQGCTNLVSLDAIASWNIDGAISSPGGVNRMFSGCDNIASITLGGANGFELRNDTDNDMSLPSANWWPVDAATPAAIDTDALVSQSQNPSTLASLRWQKCTTGSENPIKTVTSLTVVWPHSLTVVWPQTNADKEELIYNGLFQTLGTKDNKVQVTATIDGQAEPVTLTEGVDFYVVYKDADGTDSTAIKDAGDYSARVVLRGAYTGPDSDAVEVMMQQLDLASDAYSLAAYTAPNRFPYTGSAHTPKTMVRLYLRDDPNPDTTKPPIPIYTYLVENTDTRTEGDYDVSYTNNIEPGTATATISPATPEGLSQSNLKNSVNAYFAIGDVFVSFDSCGGTQVPEQGTTGLPPVLLTPKTMYYRSAWKKGGKPWQRSIRTISNNKPYGSIWSKETHKELLQILVLATRL